MIEQQFVEYVVKELVDNPDQVHIERSEDNRGVLLELSVAPEDLGRVIGRHGATAQSLRSLLRALGVKNGARYNLKIVDTEYVLKRLRHCIVYPVSIVYSFAEQYLPDYF